MPALPPTMLRGERHPAAVALSVALGAGALLVTAGCTGGSENAATNSGPTVTVTQTAAAPAPATSSAPAQAPAQAQSAGPAAPASTVLDPNADLSVKDQIGNGRSVLVKEVAISTGTGLIAIYDASGRLLGSGRVGPNVRSTTVQLSTPVPRTSQLLAVLYADNGDGKLGPTDPRVVDAEGKFRDDTFDYSLVR